MRSDRCRFRRLFLTGWARFRLEESYDHSQVLTPEKVRNVFPLETTTALIKLIGVQTVDSNSTRSKGLA